MGCCLPQHPHSSARTHSELLRIIEKEQESFIEPLLGEISTEDVHYRANVLKMKNQLTFLCLEIDKRQAIVNTSREEMNQVKEILDAYYDNKRSMQDDQKVGMVEKRISEYMKPRGEQEKGKERTTNK